MIENEITKRGDNFEVYISYCKSDGEEIARLLNLSFKNAGYRCFLTPNNYREEKIDIKLETALFETPIFVMILTEDYFTQCKEESHLIRKEIEIALANQMTIIPINYDEVFSGVPSYLDEELKNAIGAIDFVTINSGNKFASSFNAMLKKYFLNVERATQNQNNKSLVTLLSDTDCLLSKNNKIIATLQAEEESCILLSEGNHLIGVQSLEYPYLSTRITKNIPKVPWEDFIEIKLSDQSLINKTQIMKTENEIIKELNLEEQPKKQLKFSQSLVGHKSSVISVTWSKDGEFLATASRDNTIKIWQVSSGRCIQTLVGHTSGVTSANWSPNGKQIVSGSRDKSIKIWDIESGRCLKTFTGHTDVVVSTLWNIDESSILSISWDMTLKIWDINSEKCIHTLIGHESCVESAAYSPNGKLIVSASDEGILRIWDTNTGKCLQVLTGHTWHLHSATWSPNGDRIIFALNDYTVKIWDVNTNVCLQTLIGHSHEITSASFSPDGNRILTASCDATIRIWDANNGECLQTIEGHTDIVTSALWSPCGKYIATASIDSTIKIWEVGNDKCIQSVEVALEGMFSQEKGVKSVLWSKEGDKLVSLSQEGIVKIWEIE